MYITFILRQVQFWEWTATSPTQGWSANVYMCNLLIDCNDEAAVGSQRSLDPGLSSARGPFPRSMFSEVGGLCSLSWSRLFALMGSRRCLCVPVSFLSGNPGYPANNDKGQNKTRCEECVWTWGVCVDVRSVCGCEECVHVFWLRRVYGCVKQWLHDSITPRCGMWDIHTLYNAI